MNIHRLAFCSLIQRDELELIKVDHPLFSAELALQGAQLLSFQPQGQSDWLWLSEQAQYRQGQAIRGGIPICWPWFGDAQRNPKPVQQHIKGKAPAHGFARSRLWQLQQVQEACDQVRLTLVLADTEHPAWQAKLQLKLELCLAPQQLSLNLITKNVSASAVTFSQALHTYLPVSDIHALRLNGLHGTRYIDAVDDWQHKQQIGAVCFTEETDRIYQSQQPLQLQQAQQRRIISANSASTVVWNPWVDKSQRLGQFADDAWQRMVCVETANCAFDAVTLASGEQHSLHMCLR